MSKYNIHATKADWDKLYSQVEKFPELDVKTFKKSQSFDMASYGFIAYVAKHEGIARDEVTKKYPVTVFDGAIRATVNA